MLFTCGYMLGIILITMVHLDDIPALHVLEAHATGWLGEPEPCPVTALGNSCPSHEELQDARDAIKHYHDGPLSIMVSSQTSRNHGLPATISVLDLSQPLPRGSFLEAMPGVRVPCPELCFVRLARILKREQLLMLGMSLCGTYAANPVTHKIEYGLQPLTTADRLQSYIERLPRTKGKQQALEAARALANGSASPRESALYLVLTLPTRLGGFQLPRPVLNDPQALDADARSIAAKEGVFCDLLWAKQRFAVEYDSDEFHSLTRREDIERRNALESMGIRVLSITTSIFNDFDRLAACVRTLRKRLGLRVKPEEGHVTQRRRRLHRILRDMRHPIL